MSESIKAIETLYAGCRFRSRLEARWAVFFDHLGVRWEYEPEGFTWPESVVSDWDGERLVKAGRYLPDFLLPDIGAGERKGTWFEVKGNAETVSDFYDDFALLTNRRHITAIGDIPRQVDSSGHPVDEDWVVGSGSMLLDGGCDLYYAWCVCPWCGKVGIEFDARGAHVCGYKAHHETEEAAWNDPRFDREQHWRVDDKCYTGDHPRILDAYHAARSARFEHGEIGARIR